MSGGDMGGGGTGPTFEANLGRKFSKWFMKAARSKKGIQSWAFIVGIIVVLSLLFSYQHGRYATGPLDTGGGTSRDPFANHVDKNQTEALGGTAQEGPDPDSQTLVIEVEYVWTMTVTIPWKDEPDQTLKTNTPDTLQLDVSGPDGNSGSESGSNTHGQPATVTVTMTRDLVAAAEEPKAWSGDWFFNVTCTKAGDQEPRFIPSVGGGRTSPDNGNSYDMVVDYGFKVEK